ncbi:TonB-dependent receptor [Pseudoalteromonas rubra]|uniref:TonB-dependent receptor n=2 Tax=Pseudoalteromonas rubra TaxID=43658 RepID=A0A5S3WJE1_9GAMM|nr:TonB-dependent receptor [Pseudoalteromonas rubra]
MRLVCFTNMAKSVVTCYPYKSKKIHKNKALKKYLKPGRKQMLNSKITKAVRLALMYGAASATAFAVNAEEAEENIEKIEVTGSSIKGTDLAGALPVDIISAEDIKNTGVTSVPDLITQIPSMQGFTTPTSSVGGGGGGTATASLRGLGDQYTLVLLNGRRLAPSGSGGSIDLNSIPLAAVQRVEVLTDGASALYGSDAIAGVINFILKDSVDMSTVSVRTDRPSDGGESLNISFTTGFGDISSDGYNVMFSVSHDSQDALKSQDREFAKTGLLEFEHNYQPYFSINGSPNAIPANVEVEMGEGDDVEYKNFNPYLLKHKGCADNNAKDPGSQNCMFDYTSTLEIVPESERTSAMLQAGFTVTEDIEAFATLAYTDFSMTPRIAPNPTGGIALGKDSVLYDKYVREHLTQDEQDAVTEVYATWRALPGGNRTNVWDTETINSIVGLEGVVFDNIDFNTALVYSTSERTETFTDGHFFKTWRNDIAAGKIDVFALPSEFTQESLDALEAVKWRGLNDTTTTESISWDIRASQPLFELPAGEVYIGYGVDYRINSYENIRSEENKKDTRWLDGGGDRDYKLERETYGAFTEFQVPVLENLTLSAAIRYDMIGGVEDSLYEDENGNVSTQKVNDNENDTTYKVSVRYTVNDDLVIRGSVGTGFRAATMRQIAEPRVRFGVTGAAYPCPITDPSDPRSAGCRPTDIQYNILRQGNVTLSPETSDQLSVGFVYAPSNEFSFEMDFWQVYINDMVQSPSQPYLFANASKFNDSFILHPDPNNPNRDLIHMVSEPVNIGVSRNAGVDWKVNLLNELSFGTLKTSVQGTYFQKSDYTLAGTDDVWRSSLGRYGADEEIVFRNVINAQSTLTHGDFSHTLRMNYRSGWRDAPVTAQRGTIENPEYVLDSEGNPTTAVQSDLVQLKVPSHATFSYKFDYLGFENTVISAGVKNIFDKAPPMSLGDAEGHLVGYEGRYYDQFLRTYYLSVDYSF